MKPKYPTCPKCGKADEVVKVVYGYPSVEAQILSKREQVKLGGCAIGEEKWYCKRCERKF